jgi:GT2 family glycosyltransferase
MMTQPLVTVVVLAYNNYLDTRECLFSLRALNYAPLQLLLVDNGSTDGTAQRAREDFSGLTIVQTGRNLGVAGGFNPGIIRALQEGADYVFILNNDTVVQQGMLEELVQTSLGVSACGILMPKIVYYDAPQRIWSAGAYYRCFPPAVVMRGLNHLDDGSFDQVEEIAFAPTCGLLIPRRTFERVGLLDDGYFFFFDDWDFSLRVRQAGMTLLYVPSACLRHKVSRTIQHKGRSPFYWRTWGASGARYYHRFGRPPLPAAVIHLGYVVLREGMCHGPRSMWYFLQGAWRAWRCPLTPPPALPLEVDDGRS